jgi:hypothetical protein
MRALPAWSLWLPGLSAAFIAATAAGQGQSAAAELYRCHAANGVVALVSKPDPTLHDCVRVWNGGAVNESAPPAQQSPVSSPKSETSQAAASAPQTQKAEDPREARLREAKAGIVQWCQDHQPPNPKASAKDKAKLLDQCVQDKFGTYMLLNP